MAEYTPQFIEAMRSQGILPAVERFESEGIPHYVENTGGMCLVVFVEVKDGRVIGVSKDGPWVVCEYAPDLEWIEGLDRFPETLDEVVSMIAGRL